MEEVQEVFFFSKFPYKMFIVILREIIGLEKFLFSSSQT